MLGRNRTPEAPAHADREVCAIDERGELVRMTATEAGARGLEIYTGRRLRCPVLVGEDAAGRAVYADLNGSKEHWIGDDMESTRDRQTPPGPVHLGTWPPPKRRNPGSDRKTDVIDPNPLVLPQTREERRRFVAALRRGTS
jgi:hypothetical protein